MLRSAGQEWAGPAHRGGDSKGAFEVWSSGRCWVQHRRDEAGQPKVLISLQNRQTNMLTGTMPTCIIIIQRSYIVVVLFLVQLSRVRRAFREVSSCLVARKQFCHVSRGNLKKTKRKRSFGKFWLWPGLRGNKCKLGGFRGKEMHVEKIDKWAQTREEVNLSYVTF